MTLMLHKHYANRSFYSHRKLMCFPFFFAYASLLSLMSVHVAESRCILLPVVLRVLQAHMQEQRDLVMCARILTSMLSLIKKEENGTAVSIEGINSCHYTIPPHPSLTFWKINIWRQASIFLPHRLYENIIALFWNLRYPYSRAWRYTKC